MKFFGSKMTAPPPFGNFPEIHPFWYIQASLITNVTVRSRNVSIFSKTEKIQKTLLSYLAWMYLNTSSNRIKDYLVIFECFPVAKQQNRCVAYSPHPTTTKALLLTKGTKNSLADMSIFDFLNFPLFGFV